LRCLEKCEFLEFTNGIFICGYYNRELQVKVDDAGSVGAGDCVMSFEPNRCKKCVEESHIGTNTTNEGVKKIKFRLGLIGDSFYSFKDDLEQELAEIYRILKDLEEKTNHE